GAAASVRPEPARQRGGDRGAGTPSHPSRRRRGLRFHAWVVPERRVRRFACPPSPGLACRGGRGARERLRRAARRGVRPPRLPFLAGGRELLGKEEARMERLRDPSLSGPFYFWVSYTDANLGHAERAAQAALRALEEAARCGDQTTMGLANCSLSRNSYWLGRSDGIAQGRQAVALLERTEERWWLGQSYLALGLNLYHIGHFT